MVLRRYGFLIGGLVGGAAFLLSAPQELDTLLRTLQLPTSGFTEPLDGAPEPLRLLLVAPFLSHLAAGLSRAMIGACAGAAGQLIAELIRSRRSFHRDELTAREAIVPASPDRSLTKFVTVLSTMSLLQAAMLMLLAHVDHCLLAADCEVGRSGEITLSILRDPAIALSCLAAPFFAGFLYPRLSWLLGAVVAPLSVGAWALVEALFLHTITVWINYSAEDLLTRALIGVFAGAAGQLAGRKRHDALAGLEQA